MLVRRTCHHSDSLLSQLKHVPWLLSCAFMEGQQALKLLLHELQSTLVTGTPKMNKVEYGLLTHQLPNPLISLGRGQEGQG